MAQNAKGTWETSTDTSDTHPTFVVGDPSPVPRHPVHMTYLDLPVTYVDLHVTYLELPGSYMAVDPFWGVECPILTLCFYVLCAFLPSLPGCGCCADHGINLPPGSREQASKIIL